MTTEEIHNFNIDNQDIKIVKDFAYFGYVSSQEIKRRLTFQRAAKDKLGKSTKSKDMSLENNALIFSVAKPDKKKED